MAAPKDLDSLQQLHQLEETLTKDPPPLLMLHGKERYLLNRAVDAVKAATLDPRTRDFNFDLLDGKDATPARILSVARTLPMMAKRRLVLVRDVDEISAEQLAGLIAYLQAPAPETCLCFVSEKIDQRTRFFLAFKKHGLTVKLDPLSDRQLPGFVKAEAKRLKVALDAGAAERIAEEVGADLGQIADALDRLANYVAAGAPIRAADVEEVVATTRQHTVFELIDAVGAGNLENALTLLSEILSAREPALRLLALLARHVRHLWMTRDLMTNGTSNPGEIASAVGVPPFAVGRMMDQARKLPAERLRGFHELIYLTDRALKNSKLDEARHMESLVLRLCSHGEAA